MYEHFNCDDPFDQGKARLDPHFRIVDSPTRGPIVRHMQPQDYHGCLRNRFLSPEAWDTEEQADKELQELLHRASSDCGHSCCHPRQVVVLEHFHSGRFDPHRWNPQPHFRLYHSPEHGPVVIQVRDLEYPEYDETRFLSPHAWNYERDAHDEMNALLSGKVLTAA